LSADDSISFFEVDFYFDTIFIYLSWSAGDDLVERWSFLVRTIWEDDPTRCDLIRVDRAEKDAVGEGSDFFDHVMSDAHKVVEKVKE
jgi:hypothetical protein